MQITPAILDYTISDPIVSLHLEGLDNDGIEMNQSKLMSLEYTSLKYGTYILHLTVRDSRTGDVITEKKYTIIKTPGFFERMSVRLAILILMLAAIGIAVWRIMTGTIVKTQYRQIQEARDEAERANQAKSRFLANMSHEIRTPINTIMGMDEMILREDVKSAPREYYGPVVSYARNIKYASESLLSLINDLLDISKIESGKMHLVEQEYETKEMLHGITTMIRGRAEDKKLYFYEMNGARGYVEGEDINAVNEARRRFYYVDYFLMNRDDKECRKNSAIARVMFDYIGKALANNSPDKIEFAPMPKKGSLHEQFAKEALKTITTESDNYKDVYEVIIDADSWQTETKFGSVVRRKFGGWGLKKLKYGVRAYRVQCCQDHLGGGKYGQLRLYATAGGKNLAGLQAAVEKAKAMLK